LPFNSLSRLAKVFMVHKKLSFSATQFQDKRQNTRGCRLVWSRLVDLGSIDPGSNPGSPTISILVSGELLFFSELQVENCVIRCFKWFSNVLLRLKPSSLDFSTRSLSRYNMTLRFVAIAFASEGLRGEFPCYKCGNFRIN
jgi:hypothetical protein